jgi:hypothetical protein
VNGRPETRIPNCMKYEFADGYRAVFQYVEGADACIALALGTPAHVDAFLDGHKGWVFDPVSGRVRDLRLATLDESAVAVGPSAQLQPHLSTAATAGDASLVAADRPAFSQNSSLGCSLGWVCPRHASTPF